MGLGIEAIERLARERNLEVTERQRVNACRAGAVLREVGMTPEQMERYSDVVAGIGDRFAALVARNPKLPRLAR